MTVLSLLDDMVVALTTAGIPFMLTGSFAAAVHGAGRATMDIDLVIDPTSASLAQFVSAMLTSGRYVSMEAAADALAGRTMFNVVDVESGWKIDLMVRKDRPFSIEEFSRRVDLALGTVQLPVATVEDLVIAKLEWAQLGTSARQLEDVRALVSLAGPAFDRAYVERWVSALGLGAQWRAIGSAELQ
jgi:hypothetical protein